MALHLHTQFRSGWQHRHIAVELDDERCGVEVNISGNVLFDLLGPHRPYEPPTIEDTLTVARDESDDPRDAMIADLRDRVAAIGDDLVHARKWIDDTTRRITDATDDPLIVVIDADDARALAAALWHYAGELER